MDGGPVGVVPFMIMSHQLVERIGVTAGSELYRANRLPAGTPELVKLLGRGATPAQVVHLEGEFKRLKSVTSPGIIEPRALSDVDGRPALVAEFLPGRHLEALIGSRRFNWKKSLQLAQQLADILGTLHASHIVHLDVRPANFLVDVDQARIYLVDLSRGQASSRALAAEDAPPTDWAYCSPEQTGRTRQRVDHRTDSYSLGVLLYRLLSGQLPFDANDPLEWVHCHLARQPRLLTSVAPDVPPALAAIVQKLLAKAPEDRYQGAHGLRRDLDRCVQQLETTGEIQTFALGAEDTVGRLQIPRKLLGRTQEMSRIKAAFTRFRQEKTTSVLMLAGYSGVGKSSLLRHLEPMVRQAHGLFLMGKFDQQTHDIPYSTLTHAFHDLIRQILASDEREIATWRSRLREALGVHGQIMVDILPELELIVGEQPEIIDLPKSESQSRFHDVFRRFVGVFATDSHPLVLALDDLHWADPATLNLLGELTTPPRLKHLMVVGAYRDNEVDSQHPLCAFLRVISEETASPQQRPLVEHLRLEPLSRRQLGRLIGEVLRCDPSDAHSLTTVVYQKTAGNPFFALQFLGTLHDEGLLTFDTSRQRWTWSVDAIQEKGFTDSVADLMAARMTRLSAPTRRLLARLACLGPSTRLSVAAFVLGCPPNELSEHLAEALDAGLLHEGMGKLEFAHDRIREAAYALIPPREQTMEHLHVGRMLQAFFGPEAAKTDRVFQVVTHLNHGIDTITDDDERSELRALNLAAGRRARSGVAYESARTYFVHAVELLPEDAFASSYEEAFQAHLNLAECEYLTGRFEDAEQRLMALAGRARCRLDQARALSFQSYLYQISGHYNQAVTVTLEGLHLFDIDFPSSEADIETAFASEQRLLQEHLAAHPIEQLLDAPVASDPIARTAISILGDAMPVTYVARPQLFPLLVVKALNFVLQHGNTPEACRTYSGYAMLATSNLGEIPTGLKFSELALRLNDKFGDKKLRGLLYNIHAGYINPWSHHLTSSDALLTEAFHACLEVGDLPFAGYTAIISAIHAIEKGDSLDAARATIQRHVDFAASIDNPAVLATVRGLSQYCACLRGETRTTGSFDDDHFNETDALKTLEEARFGSAIGIYLVARQSASFLFQDVDSALAYARRAEPLLPRILGLMAEANYHFYNALASASLWPTASHDLRPDLERRMTTSLDKLRHWARHCPSNFSCRHALASAERARLEGREEDAVQAYDRAIQSAHENGFLHIAGLANELAAKFYAERGTIQTSHGYIDEAHRCYAQWGAHGKVAQLEGRYPHLSAEPSSAAGSFAASEVQPLDIMSIAKASQAISSHIVLDELIDGLMRILLENAGAQAGTLLLMRNEELVPVASARVTGNTVRVHREQWTRHHPLPASIINYVRRSARRVILGDVSQEHPFSEDPYFKRRRPKSLLCLPILRQDSLLGVLYLENRLVPGAFTPARTTALDVLATQAAISLENALLYADLHEHESRARRLLESNIIGVMFWELNGRIFEANDAFLRVVGYSKEDVATGKLNWRDLTPPDLYALDREKASELVEKQSVRYEKEFLRKDGKRIPVLIGATFFDGSHHQGIAFVVDLTEQKQAEARVRYLAHYDPLTELPNRVLLRDRIEQAIAYAHRQNLQVALVFLDIDHFKHVNDSLGHSMGDRLLQRIASRLRGCLREGDSLARWGGDEFVMCLPLLTTGPGLAEVAERAQEALELVKRPVLIDGQRLHVSASIGISLYPQDGSDPEGLLRAADLAMYHAKDSGRGNYRFFSPALNEATRQRLRLANRLSEAIARHELKLFYQPQVDLETGRIYSSEALLRWHPPNQSARSGSEFVAVAEETGLILPIGEWVLREACRQLQQWRLGGHPDLQVSVNVSARQLHHAGFVETVESILQETGLPAGALTLEITETVLMRDSDVNQSTLARLCSMGLHLSVDDFGTGYANLAYLQRFPIEALKIDQSFVRGLGQEESTTGLVAAILSMANILRLKVVAEGVETTTQLRFLKANGCQGAQGFFYSEPVPPDSFVHLLGRQFPHADQEDLSTFEIGSRGVTMPPP